MSIIRSLLTVIVLGISAVTYGQGKQVYNPNSNAKEDIAAAVEAASKEGKHIFLQIGGNWCPWCIKFHEFVEADTELKAYIEENFKVVKVNYDRDNRNEALLSRLEFPQRFGFPVFVVLDSEGNRIHTQNSAFLEKDKSYDKKTVMRFFKNWSPAAVHPDSYKK